MSWSEMPNEVLHAYRHAYNLPTPSTFSNEYSRILLSQGIGLRSPTSIAVRRAQHDKKKPNYSPTIMAAIDVRQKNAQGSRKDRLNQIIGQGRVGKNQLALTVRKHFNGAGLMEQDAIARFLYKSRNEEGGGRQFHLRFQP